MASENTQASKKSLFKRPTFKRPTASRTTLADINATDLFSRSNSSYLAIAEAEERKLQRKAAKAAKRDEQLGKRGLTISGQKRQRSISTSSSSEEDNSEIEKKSSQTRSSPNSPPQAKQITQLEDNEEVLTQDTVPAREQKADSDDDDDDLIITSVSSTTRITQEASKDSTDDEEIIESDDDLAELARQAREAAKIKSESARDGSQNAIHSFEGDVSFEGNITPGMKASLKVSVLLAVSSPLPGAETKVFKRPLDKRLREVRLAWCRSNGFPEEEAQHIVLLFKGKRIFDVNTPRSLGISVDEEGNARVDGNNDSELIDDQGRVIMVAVHQSDLEAYTTNQEADDKDLTSASKRAEGEPETTSQPAPIQETNIKIICRARGLKDFKVLVKTASTIARLQWAFTLNHKLPETAQVNIMLDGDILAPETTMAELGVEDMDIFDVQVKYDDVPQTIE